MLKNLSIRDRLMLILLGPLVVLLAIAALAVRDNLESSSETNDAAYRVEMSQVNTRLFDAVREEATANQAAVAEGGVDLTDVRAATDEAVLAWRERIERFRDLDVDELEGEIANFAAHRELISPNFATGDIGARPAYELDIDLLQEIAAFDGRLNGRGESVSAAGLLRSSQLTDAALSAADAQLLGLWAAYTGEVPSVALATQIESSRQALESYGNQAPADMQVAAADSYEALADEFADALPGDSVSVDVGAWTAASEERATSIDAAQQSLLRDTGEAVNDEAGSARSNMRNIGLLALAGLLVGAAILYVVVRSIRDSLRDISAEADTLARSDLPKLAQALAAGRPIGAHEDRPLLDTNGNDEISDVAESLNEIRRSASNVAQQQTDLLQSGIAEMFVNLARRNQSLVDRQLEVIDDLEAQERDADRLSQLYRVDHLATRMRRNAESLLVLADNTTPRRRGEPVDLREVVRVAIGEVEDYRRIVPIALDELRVAAHVAPDVAHLLSELMENATQSSPPGTVADVVGVNEPDGSYTVHVMDRGTGIDDDRRNHLNRVLAEPPTNTLSMSKTLGLTVVGRLAQRMALEVTLNPGTEGGTVATVAIPSEVVADWAGEAGRPGPLSGAVATDPRTTAPSEQLSAPPHQPEPAVFDTEPAAPEPMQQFEHPAPETAPAPPTMEPSLEAPVSDPVSMDMAALQDLAPLPETSLPDAAAPEPPVVADVAPQPGDGIAGLPPFPTLGPPQEAPPVSTPSSDEAPLEAIVEAVDPEPAPPLQSDLPADDAFGVHESIPAGDAEFAPPPSVSDVFGGAAVEETTPPAEPALPVEPVVDAAPGPEVAPAPPTSDAPLEPIEPQSSIPAPPVPGVPDSPMPVESAADVHPGDVFTWPEEAEPVAAVDHPAQPFDQADPFADVAPIPEAPAPAIPAHAAPGSGPVDATPAPDGPDTVEPIHASTAPAPSTPAPVAAPAGAPEMPPSPEAPVTAAGLVKRQRGNSNIDDPAGPSGDRTAPSKRSPDQVKNMLSRYKTGLQRGRDVTEGEGQS